MGLIGGLVSGTIGSLYNIASGLIKEGKANRLEKNTVRPVYTAPAEIAQNKQLAQNAAQNGMTGTEYDNQLNEINTNEAAGLSALNKGRNTLAGVGNLVAQGNAADQNLNAQDAAIQRQNLGNLLSANSQSAEYADKGFQYNQADKYAQTMNRVSQLRGVAQQDTNSGTSGLTNMATAYFLNNQGGKK